MRRLLPFAVLLAGVPLAVSAPVPKPQSQEERVRKLLGKVTSPEKGCEFRIDGDTVTAKLPKESVAHPEDWTRAMRSEREVIGDFELTAVLLSHGPKQPEEGVRLLPQEKATSHAFGGGLAVWSLEDADTRDKFVTIARWFEHPRGGKRGVPWGWVEKQIVSHPLAKGIRARVPTDPAGSCHLRLSRKGDKLFAAYSDDGNEWSERLEHDIELGRKVVLGVWAFNTTGEPVEVVFGKFALRQAK